MHRILAVAVGLFCCALTASSPAVADDTHDHSKQSADAKQQADAEMQKYMELAAPGEHHKHLAAFEGTWTAKTKTWQAAGTPPAESDGKAVNQMVLGGRFLQSTYSGTMMDMPFEGLGIDGFDNVTGKHTSIWLDNFGTMIMRFEGSCSKDDMSTTMFSDYTDPLTGKTSKMKTVSRQLSPTQHVFEMYMPTPDGKEYKNMEITYTKQAEAKRTGS